MRSVPYSSIETGVAAIAGIDPTNILAHEKVILAEYISDATRYCWDYYPWSETLITEERYFRETWESGSTYEIGAEVYFQDKYWRRYRELTQNSEPDIIDWHEIGDNFTDPKWSEEGIYKMGARVTHNDKTFICIDNLAGNTASGLSFVNFLYDQIDTSNATYWKEIDTTFDRHIPYEQNGYSVIGTMISCHAKDPRYNDSTPLDWVEGREGIYIRQPEHFNSVWLKYRAEAPTYSTTTPDAKVPSFLSSAIKAYSYKSWLIGEGQHEKAQLQDMTGLDLLVREVDKLNNQQDRGKPYTIGSEPYRRINARSNKPVAETVDKFGQMLERNTEKLKLGFSISISGKQAVVRRNGFSKSEFSASSKFARSFARIGYGSTRIDFRTPGLRGRNNVVEAGASVSFKLFTGKAHRGTDIGFVKAIEQGAVVGIVGIDIDSSGYNATRRGYIYIQPICKTTLSLNAQRIRSRNTSLEIKTTTNASGRNATTRGNGSSQVQFVSQTLMASYSSEAEWAETNVTWENAT